MIDIYILFTVNQTSVKVLKDSTNYKILGVQNINTLNTMQICILNKK